MADQEQQEIELNFRLDEHGRTAPTSEPPNGAEKAPTLDYRSQTVQTTIGFASSTTDHSSGGDKDTAQQSLLDELLFDCEIADSGLMPRTFWMAAQGRSPACSLEQLALDIFRHHTTPGVYYDPATSGAEWWVQIRPSPPAGRYAMHAKEELDDEISRQGIWFHWDKDEDLRQIMGGDTTYLHPHLSTVTYLTPHGAPTLAVNRRIHPLMGQWLDQEEEYDEAWISWPRQGKHLSFDGRFLHAAPPDLLPDEFRAAKLDETEKVDTAMSSQDRKLNRRQRRVTFLVNIWLNYRPLNVNPFPKSMMDKMSGTQLEKRVHVTFAPRSITADEHKRGQDDDWEQFKWPMGGCDSGEFISLALPVAAVQRQHKCGGNVRVMWSPASISLSHSNPAKKPRVHESTTDET